MSGGGARGAAHLGVLQALDELGIKVAAISGVSAGAVIGALYAAGIAPLTILEELKQLSYFRVTEFAWLKNGLFTMAGLRKALATLIGHDSYELLNIPLFVTATDISKGCSVTFSKGPLQDTIIGSSAVPVVFEPVPCQGYLLLDGGILNNLPVEPICETCDFVIGSHVNKLYDGVTPVKLNTASLIDQCFHLVIANSVRARALQCDIFIEPLLSGFGIFEMKNAGRIFELGYQAAMEQKEKLLAIN